jgi:hypothetical protein
MEALIQPEYSISKELYYIILIILLVDRFKNFCQDHGLWPLLSLLRYMKGGTPLEREALALAKMSQCW